METPKRVVDILLLAAFDLTCLVDASAVPVVLEHAVDFAAFDTADVHLVTSAHRPLVPLAGHGCFGNLNHDHNRNGIWDIPDLILHFREDSYGKKNSQETRE